MILPESGTLMTTVVCAECKCIIGIKGLCDPSCRYFNDLDKIKEIWTWKLEKVEPYEPSGSSRGG